MQINNLKKTNKSITLCAIDCVLPQYAIKALKKSSEHLLFDKIILFTDAVTEGLDFIQTINIPKIKSIEEYNYFVLNKLNDYIETDYVLLVQWDGYVVDPSCWTNDFLLFDYIGAVWPQYDDGMNVGNGGFSLRSKKLLVALRSMIGSEFISIPEDELICRQYRKSLEEYFDIKFAPSHIADIFSYEQADPLAPTLGFHGFWHSCHYLDDNEAIAIINALPKSYFSNYLMMKSFMSFYMQGRSRVYMAIYSKIIINVGEDVMYKTLYMALKYDASLVLMALQQSRKLYIQSFIL